MPGGTIPTPPQPAPDPAQVQVEPPQAPRLPDRHLRRQQRRRALPELFAGAAVHLHLRPGGVRGGGGAVRLHGLPGGVADLWPGDRLLPLPRRRRLGPGPGLRDCAAGPGAGQPRLLPRPVRLAAAHRGPAALRRAPGVRLVGRGHPGPGLDRGRRLRPAAGGEPGPALCPGEARRDRRQHRAQSVLHPGVPAGLRPGPRLLARRALEPRHRHRLCLPRQPGGQRPEAGPADPGAARRPGRLRSDPVPAADALLTSHGYHWVGRHCK